MIKQTVINYKGYSITVAGDMVTLFFEGDEFICEDIDTAKKFVDTFEGVV